MELSTTRRINDDEEKKGILFSLILASRPPLSFPFFFSLSLSICRWMPSLFFHSLLGKKSWRRAEKGSGARFFHSRHRHQRPSESKVIGDISAISTLRPAAAVLCSIDGMRQQQRLNFSPPATTMTFFFFSKRARLIIREYT